jgi:alkylation response protein AidB-like acyl-CoA dehydrogenase
MDFRFTEEQEKFRQKIRNFLTKELPPDWLTGGAPEDETDEWWQLTQKFLKKIGDNGWISATWPKEYGGQERPTWEDALLGEELAYFRAPAQDYWFRWKMIAALLLHFGNDEQRKQHLPGIASGQVYWTQGFSEPGAGSDLGGVQVKAQDKGDYFLVNGQKIWTTGAHRAHWCFAPLMSDPDAPKRSRMLSMFLIDMKSPGITVRRLESLEGVAHLCETFFDDVKVPKENLVGDLNNGFYIIGAALLFERAVTVSGFHRALELLTEYVKTTKRNGKPLAADPLIRHKLAEMEMKFAVTRVLSYRLSWMQVHKMFALTEVAITKLLSTETVYDLAQTGMQILGHYGELAPGSKWAELQGWFAHMYQEAPHYKIAGGTSEIQRQILATRTLGLPRG